MKNRFISPRFVPGKSSLQRNIFFQHHRNGCHHLHCWNRIWATCHQMKSYTPEKTPLVDQKFLNWRCERNFSSSKFPRFNPEVAYEKQQLLKKMLEKTGILLGSTLSVDDSTIWSEAEQVIKYWITEFDYSICTKDHNYYDRVQLSIRILDRLSGILPQNEPFFASMLETDLLNLVLARWLKNYIPNNHDPRVITPSSMTEKIEKYRWSSLVQPNSHTYHLILDAASYYRSEEDGIPFAESLLNKLIQVSETNPSESLVDDVSFGLLVKACVQRNQPRKAEAWFHRMKNLYNNHHRRGDWHNVLRPNAVVYTTVIDGWARVGNGPRAQAILDEQLDECLHNNNQDAQPDVTAFNALLNAWSRTEHINNDEQLRSADISRRAKIIVSQMNEYASTFGWNCAPDEYTYSSVVTCCAVHEGPEKAEKLLEELEVMAADGTTCPKPTIVTYNTILNSYSQAGKGKQAQNLLQKIMQSGTVSPDQTSFSTVIAAWSKSKDPDAPLRAEALLNIMNDWSIKPSVVTYSSLINAWASSDRRGAAERAEQILYDMCHSDHNIKPNIFCYNAVLKGWANEARRSRDTEPLARLTAVFDEILKQDGVDPTATTFRSMLHAVAASNAKNKLERAQVVITLMERFGFEPSTNDRKLVERLSKKKVS